MGFQRQAGCDFLVGRGKLIKSFTEIAGGRAGPAALRQRTPPFLDALDTALAQQAIQLRQSQPFEGNGIPGVRQAQYDGA